MWAITRHVPVIYRVSVSLQTWHQLMSDGFTGSRKFQAESSVEMVLIVLNSCTRLPRNELSEWLFLCLLEAQGTWAQG